MFHQKYGECIFYVAGNCGMKLALLRGGYMDIKAGDIVGRKKYGCDVLFRVVEILTEGSKTIVILYGEDFRIEADAFYDDLVLMNHDKRIEYRTANEIQVQQSLKLLSQDKELLEWKRKFDGIRDHRKQGAYFQMPGRVLHLDGDPTYLQKCIQLYEKIGVPVNGLHISEREMPVKITSLLEHYRPDILVITGHDSYSKGKGKIMDLKAYRHSWHFVQTVKEARKKIPQLDQLVIFAGACQSHFESLIGAGANFASFTPFMERIHVWDALRNTLTGEKGMGGIDTKGVLRTGMPYKYVDEEEY